LNHWIELKIGGRDIESKRDWIGILRIARNSSGAGVPAAL
jgi:hypothetical protein